MFLNQHRDRDHTDLRNLGYILFDCVLCMNSALSLNPRIGDENKCCDHSCILSLFGLYCVGIFTMLPSANMFCLCLDTSQWQRENHSRKLNEICDCFVVPFASTRGLAQVWQFWAIFGITGSSSTCTMMIEQYQLTRWVRAPPSGLHSHIDTAQNEMKCAMSHGCPP